MSKKFETKHVKEVLEKKFPNNIFRIRIPRNVMVIYTDLVVNIPSEYQDANWRVIVAGSRTDEDMHKSKLYEKMFRQNMEMEDEIMDVLRKHNIKESISYDSITGEILLGGNFYINIRPLEDYKWISKKK